MYRSTSLFQFPHDEDLKYNKKALEDLYLKIINIHLSMSK